MDNPITLTIPEVETLDLNEEIIIHHKDMVVTIPSDKQRREHQDYRKRAMGTDIAEDLASFIDIVTRFQNDTSAIFASQAENKIVAVLNHDPASGQATEYGGWKDRLAVYQLSLSTELNYWKEVRNFVTQERFSEFLEERANDIIRPEAAKVLDVANNLSLTETMEFSSKKKMSNGDHQLVFKKDTATSIEVPGKITIQVPLYEGDIRVNLEGLLRYRVTNGQLVFQVLFPDLEALMRAQFRDIVDRLRAVSAITAPIYVGRVQPAA
jgi:uncharacterized protein YfdQ (DUF2303 family)